MPGPNLGLASHEPIDEQEPASDATQTSGGEDAREPGPQTRSAARARVGFALDVANSGARFVTDVVPDQATVQARLARKATKALRTLRNVDLNDEWDEALRRTTQGLEGGSAELRENTGELFQEAVEDVLRRANMRMEEVKDDLVADYGRPTAAAYTCGRVVSDLSTRDSRKVQGLCLSFWILFLVAWEVLILATTRRLDCGAHHDSDPELLHCYNVDDLLLNLDCTKYRCAVPFREEPADERCSRADCNCGGTCDYCTECLCTVGFGPGQHEVCLDQKRWPGPWALTVRWAIVAFWVVLLALFGIKYFVGWYVEHRSRVVLYEKDREAEIQRMKMHAKMQKTRDELVGTHVEFFHAPSHLHHPDLVKAAVAQRMQDRHNYFHAADRPARLVGEASDAFLRMVGEKVGDLREHVSTEVDPALEKVYATRYCLQSVSDEKARAEKKSRAFGSTFSSMRANLGDPWLREVEKDTVPTSGRLFELYHKVAREAVGGATPENLVAEMFKAKGIHASLPFLRQWLLREPARNRSAISWPSFYSEIALAKDFILQAARGGADFGHYLTSTTDNLWGERQRKDRPSQASAMLAIAAQLIPLASSLANGGSDDEEDEESDEEREDRIADVAAGILPHALPLFRGNPPATRSEAKSQKKALLQALAKLREMLKSDGLEDEEEEETEEHSDDEMQLLRKE